MHIAHASEPTSYVRSVLVSSRLSQGLDKYLLKVEWSSLMVQKVKHLPANSGDQGSIPGSRKSAGRGNDNPLQCSCLENSMDRGPWRATLHGVTKSRTRLSNTHTHTHTHTHTKAE